MPARLLACLLALVATAFSAAPAHAAPGDLDTSFSGDGKVARTLLDGAVGRDLVVGADGGFVVAGYALDGTEENPAVIGWTAGGSPDTAADGFGEEETPGVSRLGFRVLDLAQSARFESIARQPVTDRLIAAGRQEDGAGGSDILVAGFTEDGDLASGAGGFGTLESGTIVEDLGAGMAEASSVAIQSDGKIVVAATVDPTPGTDVTDQKAVVLRYTAAGQPDTTFNAAGANPGRIVLDNADPARGGEARAVIVQADGAIAVAGVEYTNADAAWHRIDRLTSAGVPDTTWGSSDGRYITTLAGNGGFAGFDALAEQDDGTLVAAGSYDPGSGSQWMLMDFTSAGGDPAPPTTHNTTGQGSLFDLVADGDSIYATGYADGDLAVARWDEAPGTSTPPMLDTAFGSGGIATTDFGATGEQGHGIALHGGKLLAGGVGATPQSMVLARYGLAAGPAPTTPTISVADASVTEGNAASDGKHLLFTVSLSAPAPGPVSFTYSTGAGSASTGDFEPLTNQPESMVTGQQTTEIAVAVKEDTTVEPDETLTVTLGNLSGATAGDVTATGRIRNDDSAPAPAPAPAAPAPPAPPADTSRFLPFFGMTENRFLELLGLRPDRTKPIPENPRQIVLDYVPYLASRKPKTGFVDPATTTPRTTAQKTGKVRFWTQQEAHKDIAALNASGVPVIATFKPTNQPQYAGKGLVPGEIFASEPTLKNQPLTTSWSKPAEIRLSYYAPAPPPEPKKPQPVQRGACEDLADDLGDEPRVWTPEVEELIERHRKRGCDAAIDFKNPSRTIQYSTLSVPQLKNGGKRAEMWMIPAQRASLALTFHSLGSTYTPSFDDKWRLSAGLGDKRKNRFALHVTDLGMTPGKGGGPVSGVDLQFWLDIKRDGQTESRLLHDQRIDRDGRAEVLLDVPREGTVRVEAIGKPKVGPALHGWAEIPAVQRGGCFRGISGWSWSSDGVRTETCPRPRAAAFDAKWKQDLCHFICGLLPGARGLLETPEPAEKAVRTMEKGVPASSGSAVPTYPAQIALGAALSTDPAPGLQTTAPVISTGGLNFTGESSKVLELQKGVAGASVISTGGGNATDITKSETRLVGVTPVIATGGGNVIATGGGNLIGQAGGNLIGQAGGNLIGQAGGNVIATGGGNVISTGGGN